MDKELHIQTSGIQTDQKDTYYNHRYEPTEYELLDLIFDEYPLTKEDHLVDFGCGMGRLNFYVQHRFSCQTTGIELNETYYEIALKNLNSYKGIHHEQIHFHLVSAIEYTIEVSQNIFYFFNPFSIEIFMHVVGNILDSFYEHPRKITIMLNYPDSEYIYYLNEYTPFSLIQEIKVPDKYEKDSRECVLIYEMNFSI